ncbi:nucleotide exchange factor GrpE [Egicoccus sp. AB-alg6-2]|uniref:nucleotide exchange factor GrpE n=1 Tax=Egicoccus sp. AB-alg6-2 TaxID=3242692 RepID=UPI00359D42FD
MTDAGDPIPMDETDQAEPTALQDVSDATADGGTEAGAEAPVDEDATSDAEPEDPRSADDLRAELQAVQAQRDEYLDDLRRARAEFENFRKRTARESAGQRDVGRADVAGALLEVLDDLDRTLEAAEQSTDDSLAKGVTLVADKLVRTLQGMGLERLDETGVAFDPNHHEAVSQQAAEEASDHPVVAQVFRPGYRLGDRVLRPAMVVVEQ